MNSTISRTLLTLGAALLLSVSAGAQGLTREQVRAELAEARAQGLLDRPGEIGSSTDVLLAREQFNDTQARVLIARQELASNDAPEVAVYLEAGREGPVFVEVVTEPDGSIQVVDGPLPAGVMAQRVPVDFD